MRSWSVNGLLDGALLDRGQRDDLKHFDHSITRSTKSVDNPLTRGLQTVCDQGEHITMRCRHLRHKNIEKCSWQRPSGLLIVQREECRPRWKSLPIPRDGVRDFLLHISALVLHRFLLRLVDVVVSGGEDSCDNSRLVSPPRALPSPPSPPCGANITSSHCGSRWSLS